MNDDQDDTIFLDCVSIIKLNDGTLLIGTYDSEDNVIYDAFEIIHYRDEDGYISNSMIPYRNIADTCIIELCETPSLIAYPDKEALNFYFANLESYTKKLEEINNSSTNTPESNPKLPC